MITVATLLWDANETSGPFSNMYDESWADKLYRGFERNLNQPFRFIVWTDRERVFGEHKIEQRRLKAKRPDFSACIEPYELNEPMILVGLDTIICGNIDHMAYYALSGGELAVPRDPINTHRACNGVALVPGGLKERMYDRWRQENDMDWINANPHVMLDDLFPGQIQSWRVQIRGESHTSTPVVYPLDLRICYFHGRHKPDTLAETDQFIARHWR